ncbi:MAG: hypothetical protein SOI43_04335 [Olsenella sp.]|jgi:predicted metal-dependent phosphotriesterase family hydrolase
MGGEAFALLDDKIERLEREHEENVRRIELFENSVAEQLAAYGVDQATIDQMLANANAAGKCSTLREQDGSVASSHQAAPASALPNENCSLPFESKERPPMGGEILELMDDKVERLHEEGIQRGIQKGINQERAESARKMAQLVKNIADRMAACGIDQATIDQVLADANTARNDSAQK